jgi:hypothetical protein
MIFFRTRDFDAASQTHWIIGFPRMSTSGFPGKRLDAHLAGIIPITITELPQGTFLFYSFFGNTSDA